MLGGRAYVLSDHYNYFRDYDPTLGRYLKSDPIGLIGGINTFAYAKAKPLTTTDVNGLAPTPCSSCSDIPRCTVHCIGWPADVRVICNKWTTACGKDTMVWISMPFAWPWTFRGWGVVSPFYTCQEFDELLRSPHPNGPYNPLPPLET